MRLLALFSALVGLSAATSATQTFPADYRSIHPLPRFQPWKNFGFNLSGPEGPSLRRDRLKLGDMVRLDLWWHLAERQPGRFDFQRYREFVRWCESNDIRVLFVLGRGNPVHGMASFEHGPVTEHQLRAWEAYAQAAVREFGGRGHLFEVLNEPDSMHSGVRRYFQGGSFDQACRAAVRAIRAMRRVHAHEWIGGIGVEWPNPDLVNTIVASGLPGEIDFVTAHLYVDWRGRNEHGEPTMTMHGSSEGSARRPAATFHS